MLFQLWSSEGLKLLGVLRGHRRGVWFVRFSPVDQVLLSSSADCSVKLWALGDLTCIKVILSSYSSESLDINL
jgi:U3 small nucleolar RNA-associated protein 13